MSSWPLRFIASLLIAFLFASELPPGTEKDLSSHVRALLDATDLAARKVAVDAIAGDPNSKSLLADGKLSALLHDSVKFQKISTGVISIEVPLEDASVRPVTLRIPARYSADRPWPLIVAYHGTGGSGRDMIGPLVDLLGKSANDYIIACPDDYQPANVDSKRSWRPEHRLVLPALKHRIHIDNNRVYVTGFSGGGYVAWSHALYFGDEYAAAMPVACAFDAAPEIPGFWELLLPNIANIPVMNVWGADDRLPVMSIDLTTSAGTNNVLNRRLIQVAKGMQIELSSQEIPHVGHAFAPPVDLARALFAKRRGGYPKQVSHRFRYLVEGRDAWLEALSWEGDQWGLGPRGLPDVAGQSREQAIGAMIESTLALLRGKIDGQSVTIERKHVGRLAVWFGDGMIDFDQPIHVTVNGKVAFDAKLPRDLRVALMQANRTRDFDRLRWAGLMISEDGAARPLTVDDELPEIVWEKPQH